MSRKPRVLLVGPWPPTIGGVTTFMLNVANSPLAEHYTIIPFTTSRPPKRKSTSAYGYRAMLGAGLWGLARSAVVTAWHFAKFPLALSRADLVQVQASDFQAFWEAAAYVGMCRLAQRPVLMRIGGSFDRFYEHSSKGVRSLIRSVLRWPDRLIVQSVYWAHYLSENGRKDGIVVLPNFLPDRLPEYQVRNGHDFPECIFIAGAEAVWKGLNEVISAIRSLGARGVNARFRIVAASEDVRRFLADQGLNGSTTTAGYLNADRMHSVMSSADIFLLPSHGEGFPNSLLEAMAAGLACIVTPVGAVPEIVEPDGAVVIPAGNAEELANAIESLVRDRERRALLGEAARRIVAARYRQSAVVPILDAAWRSLLEGRSSAP